MGESNLPLHHPQSSSFGIQGGICEPQAGGHVLDEAHGLSVLDLRDAHPLHVTLLSHVHLLLLREERGGEGGNQAESKDRDSESEADL